MKRIALVGPITGVPHRNGPLFVETAQTLQALGYFVTSPTRLPVFTRSDATWEECLAATIPNICRADWIVVLPDWMTSRGSILEVAVALLPKKPIYRLVGRPGEGRLALAHANLGAVLCRLLDVFAPEHRIRLEEVDP